MTDDQTIKMFVGTDPKGGCAECQMVFDYSVRKNSSRPVEITWMAVSKDPNSFWYGWNTSTWSTPFSGFRWGIPEYCNYEGKAIYCDDDQVWLQDPAQLWDNPFEPNKICQAKLLGGREIRYCVMLWDNERAGKALPFNVSEQKHDPQLHQKMTQAVSQSGMVQFFDRNFNNFDGEDQRLEDIKLLHLTDMSSNPGVHMAIERLGDQAKHWYDGPLRKHRRQDVVDLFHQYYNEAYAAGYRVEDYIIDPTVKYTKGSQKGYSAGHEWQS